MAITTLFRRVACKLIQTVHSKVPMFFPNRGEVLMFHNFEDREGVDFNCSPKDFEVLLLSLKQKNVIRLEQWMCENDFVALTIDDVPESFYQYAYPLLVKYNLPFTIFVNVSLLDTPGFITTEQLMEMASCELCTVGSHGMHHSFYKDLSKENKEYELAESKRVLEKLTGVSVDVFAYPYGSYFACGLSNRHLVEKYYTYGFGTVASAITNPLVFYKYYLPRKNYSS